MFIYYNVGIVKVGLQIYYLHNFIGTALILFFVVCFQCGYYSCKQLKWTLKTMIVPWAERHDSLEEWLICTYN